MSPLKNVGMPQWLAFLIMAGVLMGIFLMGMALKNRSDIGDLRRLVDRETGEWLTMGSAVMKVQSDTGVLNESLERLELRVESISTRISELIDRKWLNDPMEREPDTQREKEDTEKPPQGGETGAKEEPRTE